MNSASDKSLNPEDAGVAQKKPIAPETLLGEDPGIKGLDELIGKIEPLLASGRLNQVVDAMSLLADLVDMTDDYMLEKLMKGFEEGLGAAWTVGNAARMVVGASASHAGYSDRDGPDTAGQGAGSASWPDFFSDDGRRDGSADAISEPGSHRGLIFEQEKRAAFKSG